MNSIEKILLGIAIISSLCLFVWSMQLQFKIRDLEENARFYQLGLSYLLTPEESKILSDLTAIDHHETEKADELLAALRSKAELRTGRHME